MRTLYRRLAWEGIRKNRRLYTPYLLTGSIMVMIFYILDSMSRSSLIGYIRGSEFVATVMSLGSIVIGVFSVLFLFYTNSFLVRQRYKEFGLYNVLGMDKGNIGRVMFWENLYVALITMVCGSALGIAMYKAAELGLLNLLHQPLNYTISVNLPALRTTALVYGCIFLLLLLNSLIRVRRAKPLELMKTANVGERFPKYIWAEALLGLVLLGGAYYLAVTIQEPLSALLWFFLAVILVILATYALFMAGSVALCRLLQKNKRYYYKANHFVSVSSMAFRMRRNGAGLASICILLTTVLVMLVSTTSMYVGGEDSIKARYPYEINVTCYAATWTDMADTTLLEDAILEQTGDTTLHSYRSGEISGLLTASGLYWDSETYGQNLASYDQLGTLTVVPLEDYNRMMGTDETLENDECLLYSTRLRFHWDSFALAGGPALRVKKVLSQGFESGNTAAMITPTVMLVVRDPERFLSAAETDDASRGAILRWNCGVDLTDTTHEAEIAAAIADSLVALRESGKASILGISVENRADGKGSFFELNGSLLFLGLMLSLVFLFAAVLIIYYKQLSEGYEDRARFNIMRKVGMTQRDIRATINSQMLTVFAAPLLLAGVHMLFAFPFLWKILMLLNLFNRALIARVAVLCYLGFALAYILVYKLTSNSYYTIVSGAKAE